MRQLGGAPHSIAGILAHMIFWQQWFHRRCEGVAEPIPQSAAGGWPKVEADAWPALQSQFVSGLEAFVKMADSNDLDHKIVPAIEVPPFSDLTKRDAVVHLATHNAHHLGQIVTLRQMMGLWPPPSGGLTW
jgi:uncharacterized damage-inducible protein DinB